MYAMILVFLSPVTGSLASSSVAGFTNEQSCVAAANQVTTAVVAASRTNQIGMLTNWQCVKVKE